MQFAAIVPLGEPPLDELAGGELPVAVDELLEEPPLDEVSEGDVAVDDPPWHSLAQVVLSQSTMDCTQVSHAEVAFALHPLWQLESPSAHAQVQEVKSEQSVSRHCCRLPQCTVKHSLHGSLAADAAPP